MTKRGKNCLKLFITSSKYEPTLQRCNGCQNICQVGHPTTLRILHAIITATSLINNTSKMFLSIKQPEIEQRQGRGSQKYHSPLPTWLISSSLFLHLDQTICHLLSKLFHQDWVFGLVLVTTKLWFAQVCCWSCCLN